jgi:hypothetical protein
LFQMDTSKLYSFRDLFNKYSTYILDLEQFLKPQRFEISREKGRLTTNSVVPDGYI